MTQPEMSIALKSPGGVWEKLGAGSLSQVIPEGTSWTHGPRGPETFSTQLKRDGRYVLPDELPFTEVLATLGGVNAWSGRLMRSPRQRGMESSVSLVGEGWMTSHLQDYPIEKGWAIRDLSRFVDSRTMGGAALASGGDSQNWTVSASDRGIILTGTKGATYTVNSRCGVTIDLGPNVRAKRVVVTTKVGFATGFNTAAQLFYIGHDTPHWINDGTRETPTRTTNLLASTVNTDANTYTTTRRYVTICLYASTTFTASEDFGVEIQDVQIYSDAAYEASNASALKASTVIATALSSGSAPRVSSDQSGITTTSFNIPMYLTDGRRSIGDIIDDVNAYHQYQFFGTPDPTPRPMYRPVPTTPTWVVSESMAYEYNDAGANEGAEIVDTCILQYTDATGAPMEYIATASGTVFSKVGYSRAKVLQARSKLTAAAAQQIAQAYVASHQTSPFKGKIVVRGKILRWADGALVDVGLITTGDAVALSSEIDPLTGSPGRLGIIQKVTYTHDELKVEIELDSSRNYIDAVLARTGIVVRG